jgi:hypothetical protein
MQHKYLIMVSSFVRRHKDAIAVVFMALLVGLFFYRTVLAGKLPVPSDALVGLYHPYRDTYAAAYPNGIPFKNFLITDPVRQQIPWRKTVIDSVRAGVWPLWNPFSFSGTPLLANIQSGALYPLNVLFFVFPFEIAWSILIMSQLFLGGVFLFWFLRNKKLGVWSSVLGAICFAFSGFSIAWLTWGTLLSTWLWTPLSLLAIDQLHNKKVLWKWATVLTASLVISFFGGHLQIFIYSAAVISAYAIWTYRKVTIRQLCIYLIIITGVALLTAPVWLRMLSWLATTSRVSQGGAWQNEGFFIPVQHLVQFIAPDYFGNPATLNYWGTWNYGEMVGYAGIVGLSLAIVGITVQDLFWVVIILVATLFAVASPISFLPYQLHIPFISLLQPTRLMAVIDLGISILAAYGFSGLCNGKRKKSVIFVLLGLLCVTLLLWGSILASRMLGISPGNAIVAKRNSIIPTILMIGLFVLILPVIAIKHGRFWKRYVSILGVVLIVFLVFDLFRFGWKFTPFTDRAYFFPETKTTAYLEKQTKPFRIMTTDDRIFPPNVNEYYGIESIAGYDPIHTTRYEEYIAAMERGSPDIQPPFGFERIIVPKNLKSPLLKLLNVRYVLSFDDVVSNSVRKVAEEGKTNVYEMSDVIPRAYLAANVVYKSEKQEVMNALYNPTFIPGFTAIVESPIHILSTPLNLEETAIIRSYSNDAMTINVAVQNVRLLVIGNIYDSGWNISIDNVKADTYKVNYLFMGVLVPVGRHTVYIRYGSGL